MTQPSNPDLQLVQKAVKGDRRAFTTLFYRYFQSVYNYALMLCRDPAMAEDLTQEAFIRAHSNLARFSSPWNFRTWIFRLTHNYFIDLIRKEREVDPLEEGDHVISTSPGPEKEILMREVADRVQGALDQLRVQHREILVLRELNGFSYTEMGEILNISISNVKVMLHRARAAFQDIYGIQLLLENPTEECEEVAELLHALHDNEDLLDQERFAREHLKDCEACQERKQWLVSQSLVFGALIPVVPPDALAKHILQRTSGMKGWRSAQRSGRQIRRILGYGGAASVLGVTVWLIFTLIFNTEKLLPNFPRNEDGNQIPAALVQPTPTDTDPEPPPPPPPPTLPPSGDESSSSERCNLFEEEEISLVLLHIQAETMNLPLYFKIEGGIPGPGREIPDDPAPWVYSARLGTIDSNNCSLQGFDDRLYCMFTLPVNTPGMALDLALFLNGCDDPIITLPRVSVPELLSSEQASPTCNKNLPKGPCEAAGGIFHEVFFIPSYCECP